MYHERWARVSFWVTFVGTTLTFFPMHIVGLLGMTRRVYTYEPGLGWDAYNLARDDRRLRARRRAAPDPREPRSGASVTASGAARIRSTAARSSGRCRRRRRTTTSPSSRRCTSPYPNWDTATGRGRPTSTATAWCSTRGHETPATDRARRPARRDPVDALRIALADRARRLDHGRLRDAAHRPRADRRACFGGLGGLTPRRPGTRRSRRRSRSDLGCGSAHARPSVPHGWWGMVLFVATEATLFASIFGTYIYLWIRSPRWPPAGIEAPKPLVPAPADRAARRHERAAPAGATSARARREAAASGDRRDRGRARRPGRLPRRPARAVRPRARSVPARPERLRVDLLHDARPPSRARRRRDAARALGRAPPGGRRDPLPASSVCSARRSTGTSSMRPRSLVVVAPAPAPMRALRQPPKRCSGSVSSRHRWPGRCSSSSATASTVAHCEAGGRGFGASIVAWRDGGHGGGGAAGALRPRRPPSSHVRELARSRWAPDERRRFFADAAVLGNVLFLAGDPAERDHRCDRRHRSCRQS